MALHGRALEAVGPLLGAACRGLRILYLQNNVIGRIGEWAGGDTRQRVVWSPARRCVGGKNAGLQVFVLTARVTRPWLCAYTCVCRQSTCTDSSSWSTSTWR